MRRIVLLLVALVVTILALACEEGEEEVATTTPSPAATGTATPDATPSPEATPTHEATPTLSPLQNVQTLCLEVQQSYPEIEEEVFKPIAETVRHILAGLGLQVVAEGTACDATLTFAVTGKALGETYTGAGRPLCYTGAEVNGQMTLTVPGRAPLTLPISERKPPRSGVISVCPDEADAPFDSVWPKAVLDGLASLWPPPQVILQALEHEEPSVRNAAALALKRGEIGLEGAREVISALTQALEDEDSSVREVAVRAMRNIGPEEGVVSPLIQAMKDEDSSVREAAVRAMGQIGPEEGVVPALIQALADEESSVRKAAALALADIGPEAKDAVPALTEALEDEDGGVRAAAETALLNIE